MIDAFIKTHTILISGVIAFSIPVIIAMLGAIVTRNALQIRLIFLLLYSLFILHETLFGRSIGTVQRIATILFWSYAHFSEAGVRNQILLNIFLFIPFGSLLSWATRLSFKHVILFGCLFSFLIEMTQYIFCLGLCEFDDVFHNTLGTVIGFWYWRGINYMYQHVHNNVK